ncbi:hypothetical protein P8452_65874 [Trifolium repens]|nr:hypothetical protein P8452_65874 [Trifolium repens]
MFLKPKLQTSSNLNHFTPQTDHLQASDLRFLSSNLRSQIATLHTNLKSLINFNFPISRGRLSCRLKHEIGLSLLCNVVLWLVVELNPWLRSLIINGVKINKILSEDKY